MVIVLPSRTADPLENVIVPKSEIGRMRRRANGASSIHSAELSEDVYCTLRCSVCPEVVLAIEKSQLSPSCWSIETLIVSPGKTVSGTACEASGSISIHAWYVT